MRTTIRRHCLALTLVLAAAAAQAEVGPAQLPAPALPDAGRLVAGSGWQVDGISRLVDSGMRYRQWRMRDETGDQQLLFIGTTAQYKVMLHWSGELGYQGEGYEVTDRHEQTMRLRDGRTVAVSRVQMRRLGIRLTVEYAVVAPDGIRATGTQSALRTAWNVIRGGAGPYYALRVVEVPGRAISGAAGREPLLATVLWALSRAPDRTY